MTSSHKNRLNRPHVAILGAGISGLAMAHECRKRGYNVSIYDKEQQTGGKCLGTVVHGCVHELTHRQLFAKNHNLLNFLKEIPTETGSCFDSLYPQEKVQFVWGKKGKTMQFQRRYFRHVEKLMDDAKSAYAMLYSKVPVQDVLWFKKQLEQTFSAEKLLKTPVSEYFEYQQRPRLAQFLKPVLLGWIGATDSTPALSVLDLLNNKTGTFHPDSPNAYSLGIREPIGDAIITPLTEHLIQSGVHFYLGCEVTSLKQNESATSISSAITKEGEAIEADFFVLALPAHVTEALLGNHSKALDYNYVFSHGFQFHFSQMPASLKGKTVGIVVDSPWGLSYHITSRKVGQVERVCLSVTATDLNHALGVVYQRPMLECNEHEVRTELLTQLFGNTSLAEEDAFMSFHVGLGAKLVPEEEVETSYKTWFKGGTVRDEQGNKQRWVIQHALTHPTAKSMQSLSVDAFHNLFLVGEYLSDSKQTWHVPVTLERCIETVRLSAEQLSAKEDVA
ncbi:FAD-dependent oxidoreductase [Vibrio sp. vnigr-6D03]|uniref:NAD(P)-binding protein n=1 Tax=Vibrio sp. vnigr-6D03 TaxID=2058088 RepID=UPI000C31DBE8|nr:NAD(P)-binding protein [Vibrio sp. vnigr-6D03]PKF76565.1 FAD-dependent oxidoreductase [Vibrio sp. vnigr-6D03]